MSYEEDEFDEEELDIEEDPTLRSVVRFNKLLSSVHWFQDLGEPLDKESQETARYFADALGFPDAYVALIGDWEEAAYAAANPDWNTEGWEAEEQLMATLTNQALDLMLDHLRNGTPLPPSQVVRTTRRGAGAPPLTAANIPDIAWNPAPGDAITFAGNQVRIPD